jgi:hypothetical protein
MSSGNMVEAEGDWVAASQAGTAGCPGTGQSRNCGEGPHFPVCPALRVVSRLVVMQTQGPHDMVLPQSRHCHLLGVALIMVHVDVGLS